MSGLAFCTPYGLERLARATTIMDRRTSQRALWDVNDEQVGLWRTMAEHRFTFGAKPRKVGWSLAGSHATLHETDEADRAGNRMRSVFAIDTDAKAREHLERAEDMADQWKIKVKPRRSAPYSLVFRSGSHYDFLTMGSDEPGRGGDIHRLQITELPYAAHPEQAYHALRSACADNAPVHIETTLTTLDPFTASLWRGARRNVGTRELEVLGTEFHRHVSLVEHQASYRSDELITDEEWAFCIEEGFTDRRAAAWWLRHALPNLCSGNRVTLFHDYPQHRKHLLAASTGRVVEVTPELAEVDGYLAVPGLHGGEWMIEVYAPLEHSGQVVVTIDSAQGARKTNSIVLATDKRTRRPLACFWDNTIMHDDLARVAQVMREMFKPRALRYRLIDGKVLHTHTVTVHCEMDGAGRHTAYELEQLGVPYEGFWQSKEGRDEKCITQAKRRVEANPTGAPLVMQEECDELTRDEKNQLTGRKDCLMMYGMANIVIDERPYQPPRDKEVEKERANRFDSLEDALRDVGSVDLRPKWGS